MIRRALLPLVAFALLAPGCDDEPHETLRSELRRARTVWASHAIDDYDMTLRATHGGFGGIAIVRVRDGEIVSREPGDVLVQVVPPEQMERFLAARFPEVEGIFEEIRDAIDLDVARIEARFQPDLGFPRRVRIDPVVEIADDETIFEVLELEIVRPETEGEVP